MKQSARTIISFHGGVLLALVGSIFGLAAWLEPAFVLPRTQLEISTHAFELALLALPMTLVIISGGIDLSVGSTMALSSVTLGLLREAGAPMPVAGAGALAVGTAAGALNGFFVGKLQIHPLLVTLATLAAYRGLAEGVSHGRQMSGFPESFLELGTGTLIGIPIPLLILMVATAVAWVVTVRTVSGSRIYAIGGNERAAVYAAIPAARVKFALYTLSGATAACCAIVFAARRNTAKADVGSGIELEVITAVVLGGTSIFGGRGTVLGTVLGVLIVHELREFVGWRWGHDEIVLFIVGATLIGSVLVTNLASRRKP